MGEAELRQLERYSLHRCALAPLLPLAPESALRASCEHAVTTGEETFTAFLTEQGLAPLWAERIAEAAGGLPLSREAVNTLQQSRLNATGLYLLQRHRLQQAGDILNSANIPHALIKGSHTRELYHDVPALRPAVDIDILVKPEDRLEAIRAFQAQGFTFHGPAHNLSHECNLVKGNTAIDLHWDILRPGRTREPVINELLADRVDYGSHWGLGHAQTLFLMLVHPVFAKYTTTPHASLVRLVDLAQLLHRHPQSMADAETLLRRTGLATAGWISCSWLYLLTGSPAARDLATRLEPGSLRRQYLQLWLANDLPTRLLGSPLLIQLGFTLPAHDTFRDAMRAANRARRLRREAALHLPVHSPQSGLPV